MYMVKTKKLTKDGIWSEDNFGPFHDRTDAEDCVTELARHETSLSAIIVPWTQVKDEQRQAPDGTDK